MKKIVIFLITLAMILSLALTGCGQRADEDNVGNVESGVGAGDSASDDSFDFDTGDSSIMDGTNNPDGDSEDYPLGNDESIPDGSAEWEATHGGGNNQNPDRSYTWQVGNYTLTTKINVMDYIDGDIFRANEMAIELGWDPMAQKVGSPIEKSSTVKTPVYYQYSGILLRYSRSETICNGLTAYVNGETNSFLLVSDLNYGEYSYRMNDSDKCYWNFENIVCFAYALENGKDGTDPFSGILYEVGGSYYYDR